MCLMLRDALRVGCIAPQEEFFCHTHPVAEMRHRLADELKNYTVIVEPGRTPFARVRKTYSGKIGGRQDDACIALQLAQEGGAAKAEMERQRRLLELEGAVRAAAEPVRG